MVRAAVTTHAPRKSAGESVPRAISASTIKMPEPIIEPITSAVELKRPRDWTIPEALGLRGVGWRTKVRIGIRVCWVHVMKVLADFSAIVFVA